MALIRNVLLSHITKRHYFYGHHHPPCASALSRAQSGKLTPACSLVEGKKNTALCFTRFIQPRGARAEG
ncbi:hypothetical protein POVWA2_081460 [Plasmodium ovale wallikeri]|uniref:Uncharacterized protein n=1 Tax=Plasmodium ovale wallikeri TaxID=864142 RepID=A0A1A9AM93_PLAOA|nr:hypothetical protein POVWA1_026180 [Plasmodium ovale wallikeri]SBT57771.1 hypothetical protein POVWA2_081460 [Plasmodium ovale wallikeri]